MADLPRGVFVHRPITATPKVRGEAAKSLKETYTVAYIALAHGNDALTAHEYRRISSMRFARQRIGRASLQAIYDHLVP